MKCIIDSCEKQARSKNMCPMHYQRDRLGLVLEREYDNAECLEVDCNEKAGPKTGLCKPHYKRNWRNNLRKFECTRVDCDRPQHVLGLCDIHALEERVAGKGPVKGSEWLDKDGYVMVYYPGHPNSSPSTGTIMKHRLVMSEHLNRPLFPHENVHHKYGNKQDNRIENLELWTVSQPSGQRVEDKIAWAVNFLKEYGYDCVL